MGAALAQNVRLNPDQLTQEFMRSLWLTLLHPTESDIAAAALANKEVTRPYNKVHCPRPNHSRDYSARIVRKGSWKERRQHPTVILYTYENPELDTGAEAQPLKLVADGHEHVYMRFRPGQKAWALVFSLERPQDFNSLLRGDFSPLDGKQPDNIFLFSND